MKVINEKVPAPAVALEFAPDTRWRKDGMWVAAKRVEWDSGGDLRFIRPDTREFVCISRSDVRDLIRGLQLLADAAGL